MKRATIALGGFMAILLVAAFSCDNNFELCPPGEYPVANIESWECWKNPTTTESTTTSSTTTTTSEVPSSTSTSTTETTSVSSSTTSTQPSIDSTTSTTTTTSSTLQTDAPSVEIGSSAVVERQIAPSTEAEIRTTG